MLKARYLVVALMLSAAVGCGSDSDDKKTGSEQTSETQVTVSISAAKGGEVKLGKASLTVPAGALAKDIEVTLEAKKPASTLPEQSTLKGMTYDFGPDGTTFEKPVTLEIPVEGQPAEGETAVVSWYDTATKTWQDLPTTVSGGRASAEVEHFTLFVIRFIGTAAGALDCSFDACSGEGLEGTWSIAGACIEQPNSANPFAEIPGCEDAVFDIGLDAEGEITFADGKYESAWKFVGNLAIDLTSACFAKVGQGQECGDFKPDSGVVCETVGDHCKCSGPAGEPDEKTGKGAYEVSGSSITLTDDESTEGPKTHAICVKGDTAKIQQVETELDDDTGEDVTTTTLLVLQRQ